MTRVSGSTVDLAAAFVEIGLDYRTLSGGNWL